MYYLMFSSNILYMQNIFSIIANSCITIMGFVFVILVYLFTILRPKFTEPITYIRIIDENNFPDKAHEIVSGDLIIKLSQFVYSFVFVSFSLLVFLFGVSLIILSENGISKSSSCVCSILCGLVIAANIIFQKKTIVLYKLWRLHTDYKWKTLIYISLLLLSVIICILIYLPTKYNLEENSKFVFQILIFIMIVYLVIYLYFLIQNISIIFIISIDYFRLQKNFYDLNVEIMKSNIVNIGRNYKNGDTEKEIRKWQMFSVASMKIPPSIDEDELDKLISELRRIKDEKEKEKETKK